MDRGNEAALEDDVQQKNITQKEYIVSSETELEDVQNVQHDQKMDMDTTMDEAVPPTERNTSKESIKNEKTSQATIKTAPVNPQPVNETKRVVKDEDTPINLTSSLTENDTQLKKQRDVISELETAVKREVNARKELEDMLMRMEQHLKTEESARKHAEKMLDESLKNEINFKKELDSFCSHQKHLEASMAEQKLTIESEKESLDSERQQLEEEITTAKEEARRAVEDLKTAEDRVRASERIEMSKMESEYQKRISTLAFELERVRQELVIRTKILSEEMERWRQQAEYTAAAVIEAKAEVSERKRDLDSTRDKMDKLMDRLHVGREQGLVLQASLTAANAYTSHAQRTLISSMETSIQQNVQQALPWGTQIGEKTGGLLPTTVSGVDDLTMFKRGVDVGGATARTHNNKPKLIDEQKKPTRRRQR
eukprot:g1439.t1